MSALLIALKGFLQSFNMGMGSDMTFAMNSATRGGGKGTYGLKEVSKSSRSRSRVRDYTSQGGTVDEEVNHAGKKTQYQANIFHTSPSNGDNGSVRSTGSQRPMIKYDVQYSVSYEDKEEGRRF